MKEYGWQKWVKNMNQEEKKYRSSGEALEKVNRIVNTRVINKRRL
jgi:DNA/RNA-binding domain of Phe-tRNA-synthetase-like protein